MKKNKAGEFTMILTLTANLQQSKEWNPGMKTDIQILSFGYLKQEDCEIEDSLDYMMKTCLQTGEMADN
jgi:hypothetical protein